VLLADQAAVKRACRDLGKTLADGGNIPLNMG
jgi:hypothetical protein